MPPTGFEQFATGQVFTSGQCEVSADSIKTFAHEFDPQAQHMDERAAAATMFGGLVASGWQTACLTMRLTLQSGLAGVSGRSAGLAVKELKWLQPVNPGDVLSAVCEVQDVRASRSKPDYGIVLLRTVTHNQHDVAVLDMTSSILVLRTGASP